MPHASVTGGFGSMTIFEEDGALVALEWGRAPEQGRTPLLLRAIEQLEAYFDGKLREFSLPLRPHGSPFQQRVWVRLRDIPYGEVQSYGRIATELGTSPRAVARACASNPLPILIPCHRVVAAAGGLGGYSGGEGALTKKALLQLEGASVAVRFRPRFGGVETSTQAGD